jgi:Ni/Co efflux regulator RcnB
MFTAQDNKSNRNVTRSKQLEFHMNSKQIFTAIVAMSILSGGSAIGQGRENRGGQKNRIDHDARRPSPPQNQGRSGPDNHDRRSQNSRQPALQQYQEQTHHEERGYGRGAGPDHEFHRGSRLPDQYRSYRYVVEDWRGHQLTAPPRGYHWVQTGSDYVLVAIATGVILQLLLNN